jgi:hypothetical protein
MSSIDVSETKARRSFRERPARTFMLSSSQRWVKVQVDRESESGADKGQSQTTPGVIGGERPPRSPFLRVIRRFP